VWIVIYWVMVNPDFRTHKLLSDLSVLALSDVGYSCRLAAFQRLTQGRLYGKYLPAIFTFYLSLAGCTISCTRMSLFALVVLCPPPPPLPLVPKISRQRKRTCV
jgi:hypothetical protein